MPDFHQRISGLNDAKSFLRKGGCIRVKPLAMNLAGVYDVYRRPKLAAASVKALFSSKPENV